MEEKTVGVGASAPEAGVSGSSSAPTEEPEFSRLVDEYWQLHEQILEKARNIGQIRDMGELHRVYESMRNAVVFPDKNSLREELKKLAKNLGGCVSCKHSAPHPDAGFDLIARTCRLGLSQQNCNKYEPFFKKK